MPQNPLVIGLTGTNASGKGTVAEYLKRKGFLYSSCSDVIRKELKKNNLEVNRENLIEQGNELRETFGPAVLAERLKENIKDKNTIVDSIRNPHEVEELRKLDNFILLAVDAPIEQRFDRAMKRGRSENAKTLEEFKALEDRERNSIDSNVQQIDNTMKLADELLINDTTVDDLYDKVEKILKKKNY